MYESSDDFGVFPTFAVAPAMRANAGLMSVPGVEFDLSKVAINVKFLRQAKYVQILHGEQYIESFGSLPTEGTVTSQSTVVDVLDKGTGALIVTNGSFSFSSNR